MIEFESVGKTFRDGTAAVVNLSLTVPSDKITVIVGPSGCGKTTTLRMVNRMIEPTSGRILWDGSPLRSKRKTTLRRQMGYVIQNGGLFPHRTVVDNVGTVPGLLGWDKNKTRNRSMELLDAVGLDRTLAERYPAQLSGGQQQRVGVARALAADPLVMLMDEPFSAVDPVVRSELHELFLGLQRDLSKTIILITHDIDEAIKLGDQVAILRVGGHLAQVGTPQQVLDEPADAFVEGFVGRDRGFRALSFLPASSLSLERVRAVRDPSSVTGSEPVLVVDSEAKPLGWADGRRPGAVYGLGSTFDPEKDSLRIALDAALTSPVGVAVAVSGGRYAGVVSARQILAGATESRASVADSISVREQSGELTGDRSSTAPVAEAEPTASGSSEPEPAAADVPPDDRRTETDDAADPGSTDQPPTEVALAGDVPVDVAPDGEHGAAPDEIGHVEAADSADPAEPSGSTGPDGPAQPFSTTDSDGPAEPSDPADATSPVAPAENERSGGSSAWVVESPAGSTAEQSSASQPPHRLSEGRGSEEPGSADDELDGARGPWNPFKRSS